MTEINWTERARFHAGEAAWGTDQRVHKTLAAICERFAEEDEATAAVWERFAAERAPAVDCSPAHPAPRSWTGAMAAEAMNVEGPLSRGQISLQDAWEAIYDAWLSDDAAAVDCSPARILDEEAEARRKVWNLGMGWEIDWSPLALGLHVVYVNCGTYRRVRLPGCGYIKAYENVHDARLKAIVLQGIRDRVWGAE